jgi:hypothetical protein
MSSASNQAPVLTLECGDAPSEPVGAAGSGSGLHVTVASGLAQNLGARGRLIVTEVVPFCFTLDKPPVSIDLFERRPLAPGSASDTDESDIDEPDIEESDIDAEEVNIEIYLCCDRARSPQESNIGFHEPRVFAKTLQLCDARDRPF